MAKSLVSCFLTHGVCLSCTFFDILTLICQNFRRSRDFDTYAVVHVRLVLSTNNLQTNFEMASYNERPKIKNRITWPWPSLLQGLSVILKLTLHRFYHCIKFEFANFNRFGYISKWVAWPWLRQVGGYIVISRLTLHMANPPTKFDVSSFCRYRNIYGGVKF